MAERDPQVTRVEVAGRRLRLTSLDKVMYPATETTKGEVLDYYARVSEVLLPHLAAPPGDPRPLAARRRGPAVLREEPALRGAVLAPACPGRRRHLPARPGDRRAHLPRQPQLPRAARPAVDGRRRRRAAEPRPARHRPRPGQAGRAARVRAGRPARARPARPLGLEMYPVTSGSKGMQLYAALGGDLTSDQVRDLAQQLAQEMTKKHPDLVLWKMTKSLRPGKVFLDWSQNVAAKTTISPYSLRGRELPQVAAPRTWEEVEAGAEQPGALDPADVRRGARAGRARRRPPRRPPLTPALPPPPPRDRVTRPPGPWTRTDRPPRQRDGERRNRGGSRRTRRSRAGRR